MFLKELVYKYYFSSFYSRLEGRAHKASQLFRQKRRPAIKVEKRRREYNRNYNTKKHPFIKKDKIIVYIILLILLLS